MYIIAIEIVYSCFNKKAIDLLDFSSKHLGGIMLTDFIAFNKQRLVMVPKK